MSNYTRSFGDYCCDNCGWEVGVYYEDADEVWCLECALEKGLSIDVEKDKADESKWFVENRRFTGHYHCENCGPGDGVYYNIRDSEWCLSCSSCFNVDFTKEQAEIDDAENKEWDVDSLREEVTVLREKISELERTKESKS